MKCPIIKKCGGCFYPQDQYQEELKEKTLFIEKEIKKNTREIISELRSAKPRIFSTVFLSPFPQYWAHKTEVPVAIP